MLKSLVDRVDVYVYWGYLRLASYVGTKPNDCVHLLTIIFIVNKLSAKMS